ncbi:terminase large subunit [Bradyrhizobium sp. SZCCHNR2032]|uniref:terminase large subunit n=1 Tax=Bradyrhizobium sp. SZCCHNR2032 TaxID=3057384 RepID=UPI002915F7D7|nr:terminase TerL endonuclease subunit [Bradyrhizobium sp. SZCCHNR2032]
MTVHPTWVFDSSPISDPHGRGERAVKFFRALKHPKSTAPKNAFELAPFWERILRRIYGPSDVNGHRQVRTVYIQIPRGARKTTFGAGLGLLHSCGHEKVPGGACILAASAEDQAELAFDEAKAFIKATPALARATHLVDSELELEHLASGATLQAIPAEGDVQQGKTPYFVLIDELHVWKNRRLWRALKSGLLKVPNTLLVIITTAGRGQDNLGYEEYSYAKKIAAGEIINRSYLPIIFEPPAKFDWRDEKVWHRVNPGLKYGFPDIVGMRQAAEEAKEKPADREDFRQYNLNQWLDSASAPFVEMAVYDQGAAPVDLDALASKPCWLSVDLSSNTDLAVVMAAWPDDAEGYDVHPFFFCPRANLRERENKTGAPYAQWERDGLITATEGSVIDFNAIQATIEDLCSRFNVQEIAFDPYLARMMQSALLEKGLPVVDFRQVPSLMMPAISELERAVIARRFRHGGHPVLRFCFANAEVERNKQQHAVRFYKSKKWLSIDGAVAAAMAVSRAATGESNISLYANPAVTADMLVW